MKTTCVILLLVTVTTVSANSLFNRRGMKSNGAWNKSAGGGQNWGNGTYGGKPKYDPCGDEGRSIRRVVSLTDLNKFLAKAKNMSQVAIRVFNHAVNGTVNVESLQGQALLNKLDWLMTDLQKLGDAGEDMIADAKVMVARIYLIGIQPENRCMRKDMPKRGRANCSPAMTMKRQLESKRNGFIACLFDNVGEMVDSIIEIYEYVQYSVTNEWPGGFGCSNMAGIYDSMNTSAPAVSSTGTIAPALIPLLRTDLQCIGATLSLYNQLCGEWKFTDESPDEIRFHLVAGLALMEMIYEEAVQTLTPVMHVMDELYRMIGPYPGTTPSTQGCPPNSYMDENGTCVAMTSAVKRTVQKTIRDLLKQLAK